MCIRDSRKAMEGTILAHTDGGVPEVLIEVDDLTAYNAVSYTHLDVYKRQGVPSPPVWVESTNVGRATGCTPMTDSTGRITARLQRPMPERSWMQRTFLGSTGCIK